MKEKSNDLYNILGIVKDAAEDEIKKAYRKKAKEVHPDVNNNNDDDFVELNKAYKILSDPIRRENYDKLGYDDPEMLNKDKLAKSMIETLFSQFLLQNESIFETKDIFEFIREMINKKSNHQFIEKNKFKKKIKFLNKVKKRIKFKNNNKKDNFITLIIDSQINQLEIETKKLEFYKEINNKAIEILKNYSYDLDISNNQFFTNLNPFMNNTSTSTNYNSSI